MKYTLTKEHPVRIAISSKSGCGNTTVSTIVSKTLGIPLINYTFRQLAEERGMTLHQVMEAAKTSDEYDKYIDTHQVELAMKSSCVLASRLAIWMLKEADLKVYLTASADTRAERIYKREGGNRNEIRYFTAMRDKEDNRRYKLLYGIDNDDYKGIADFVIDTNNCSAQDAADMIIKRIGIRG